MNQKRCAFALLGATMLTIGAVPTTSAQTTTDRSVTVASKPFGESYLLAEMFAQLLEAHGFSV
ncbi:MAG TPA: hypothetical protein VF887_00650, partial [Gemmatimonadaceae bacterium]